MKRPWRSQALRAMCLGLMAGVAFLATGDRARATAPTGVGIDPFDVLDLQVKNNVLFIIDTSGSMKWPPDTDWFDVGDDDPASRIYQAKQAITAVVNSNKTTLNMGLATYNILDSTKNLNYDLNSDFDGDARIDGPLIYVSKDSAAGLWLGTATTVGALTGSGFFNGYSDTFTTFSLQTSTGIFASLKNTNGTRIAAGFGYQNAYPPGCTPGTTCRYYLQSKLFRSGFQYTWNRTLGSAGLVGIPAAIPGGCPLPPVGLTGNNPDANGDGLSDQPRPCFQLVDSVLGATAGNIATYYYTSALFEEAPGAAFCGGAAVLNSVAPCSGDNSNNIVTKMAPAAPTDAFGNPIGFPTAVPAGPAVNMHNFSGVPVAGLREDQSTPLAGSLDAIRTAGTPAFPPSGAPGQKNFVIIVTDGDDTCADTSSTDHSAVLAAVAAQNLYQQGSFNPTTGATTDFQHRAETMVIGFATSLTPARINVIAQGGSGANINGSSTNPATAVTGCNPGGACRNAFTAQNTQQLIDALQNAIQQAASAGEFSTTRSVFDAVFEYAAAVGPSPSPSPTPSPFDPMNPDNRFLGRTFRSFQTTFEMPTFKGHLKAFAPSPSPSPTTTQIWDAGAQLLNRLETGTNNVSTVNATFDQLHGGLGPTSNTSVMGSTFRPNITARIDRRIFTNARNGVAPARAMLWPPDAAVAPNDDVTDGSLDDILGIGRNSNPAVTTLAQLQVDPFHACQGASLPTACTNTTTVGSPAEPAQLRRARREAREMILAYMAGAAAVRDASKNPVRNAAGNVQYLALPWLLAEDTLGPMAVVTPPQQTLPLTHVSEYILFRDGPRINSGTGAGQAPTSCVAQTVSPFPASSGPCLGQGFGLRNPDFDGQETPPNSGGSSRPTLKPVMSVVYVASNDMLHAFRAGPCPTSVGAQCAPASQNGSAASGVETGGEELWGFVPYDLLPKLRLRMLPQARNNHTFMLAAGVRFAEVFVPEATPFTIENRTYTGRWRRILVFGRGLGARGAFGKYYTALDVTAPGPFTISSLDTQLPDIWWSRGNPDIQTIGSATNNGSTTDATLFQNMGQTWSVPAISRVDPAFNVNQRLNIGREYVVYMGSGYGETATEGTRFYTLDAITGDIVASADVGSGGAPSFTPDFQNALVAAPAIFVPTQTLAGVFLPNPAGSLTTAAYIGDIHGRVWKFGANAPGTAVLLTDMGRGQPVAAPAATLNVGGPLVFVGTGNDARVPLPSPAPATGPFQVMGVQDNGSPGTTVTGFPVLLPTNFRNTNPARTAFITQGPAAFFSPTRFNPAVTQCLSSFDTTILGISATNGNTVYENLLLTGVKAVSDVKITDKTRLPDVRDIDQGTPTSGNPPPPAVPPADKPGQPLPVTTTTVSPASTVCR